MAKQFDAKISASQLNAQSCVPPQTSMPPKIGLYLIGTIIFRRASGIPEVTYRYIAACMILILIVLVLAESNWASQST
jgi:hypothetical protein